MNMVSEWPAVIADQDFQQGHVVMQLVYGTSTKSLSRPATIF